MTRFFTLTLLLFCALACKQLPTQPGRKTRRRKPLIDFGSSKEETRALKPTPLFVGKKAKEQLAANKGRPIRIGSASKKEKSLDLDKFKSINELLVYYETAPAAERPTILQKIFKLQDKAAGAIQQRQSELRFLHDTYSQLLAQIDKNSKFASQASPIQDMEGQQLEALYIQRKLRLALDRYLNGDYLGARSLATALLTIAPNCTMAPKIKRIRKYAREHLLRESVLYTELLAPPIILSKTQLRVALKLSNRTQDPLFLMPPKDEKNKALGNLDVSYEEQYAGGTRSRDQSVVPILEKKAISLKPGQSIRINVKIPLMHRKKSNSVLGVYNISGYLRPFKLIRGNQELPYLIPIFGIRSHVVGKSDIALIRNPLGCLKDQLDALDDILKYADAEKRSKRFQPKVQPSIERLLRATFLTAVLAGETEKEKTFKLIEAQLKIAPPKICLILCSALSSITRDPFQYSKAEWLEWFSKDGHRAFLRPKEKLLEWPSENR